VKARVFYSWQSDTPAHSGRTLIHEAIQDSIAALAHAVPQVELELDHDTRGVPGSPTIVAAILRKIDQCAFFVADVTLTFERQEPPQRRAPNPNVLLELGYALKRLGSERVLLVMDLTRGSPEDLPFNLRGVRVATYRSDFSPQGASVARADLAGSIQADLAMMIVNAAVPSDIAPPVRIELRRTDERIASDRHDYRLHVMLSNHGDAVAREWAVEVRFPTILLNPHKQYSYITNRRDDGMTVMRQTAAGHSGPLFPGDEKDTLGIDYMMTHELWDRRSQFYDSEDVAVAYVDDKQVHLARKRVQELQNF
jgi:hypothetical protein